MRKALSPDSLYLLTRAGDRVLALNEIARVQSSAGEKLNWLGGLLGIPAGGAIGFMTMSLAACSSDRGTIGVSCDEKKLTLGLAAGALAGGVVGTVVLKREKWVTVPPGRY